MCRSNLTHRKKIFLAFVFCMTVHRNGVCDETVKKVFPTENRKLSLSDQSILEQGYISNTRYVVGGVVGTFTGFGIGHGIQGRFSNRGVYFLLAEAAAFGIAFSGGMGACGGSQETGARSSQCNAVLNADLALYVGARIWETYDLWASPINENARYLELKKPNSRDHVEFIPYLAPTSGSNLTAGLEIRF